MNKEFFKSKQQKEEELFEAYAKSKDINRYHFTALDCPYDVAMQSGSTYIIAESKVREGYDNAFFNTYGPFLEHKKLDGMLKQKQAIKANNGINVEMFYFNFTKDSIQIFRLKEPWEYGTWSYQKLPKDNMEPHIKIQKLVTTLKNPEEIIMIKK